MWINEQRLYPHFFVGVFTSAPFLFLRGERRREELREGLLFNCWWNAIDCYRIVSHPSHPIAVGVQFTRSNQRAPSRLCAAPRSSARNTCNQGTWEGGRLLFCCSRALLLLLSCRLYHPPPLRAKRKPSGGMFSLSAYGLLFDTNHSCAVVFEETLGVELIACTHCRCCLCWSTSMPFFFTFLSFGARRPPFVSRCWWGRLRVKPTQPHKGWPCHR